MQEELSMPCVITMNLPMNAQRFTFMLLRWNQNAQVNHVGILKYRLIQEGWESQNIFKELKSKIK